MAGPAAQLDEAKRFAEIVAILQKHHLVQGLTPEKVRDIFVDLGPTFVKFGQILSMRSDILPKEYCLALETLRHAAVTYARGRFIIKTSVSFSYI